MKASSQIKKNLADRVTIFLSKWKVEVKLTAALYQVCLNNETYHNDKKKIEMLLAECMATDKCNKWTSNSHLFKK